MVSYDHPRLVRFPIETCSRYDDKRQPERYDMDQIAWIIRTRNRGPMGFVGDGKTEVVIEPPAARKGEDEPSQPT